MRDNNIFFNTLLISLLTLILIYTSWVVLLPLFISYLIYFICKYKTKSFYLPLIISLCFVFNYDEKVKINSEFKEHTAVVENVYNTSITVNENGNIYYIMKVEETLTKGDVIKFKTKYYNDVEKGSFDIFYRSTKAEAYGYASELEIIERDSSYRSNLHNSLYEESTWYTDITLTMLYGEEQGIGESLRDKVNLMGVSHLFVVSGFHISLFFIITECLLKFVIKSERNITFVSGGISLFFLYLIYFPPTGVRALSTLVISRLLTIDSKESLAIVGLCFFVINPWLMMTSSMILSFSITYAIYIYHPSKDSIVDMFAVSMFAFYISLPTISTWEESHNLFSPLLSVVMTPIVSFMYIVSLVTLPFHGLWGFMDNLYFIFYLIVDIFSSLNLIFITPTLNPQSQFLLIGISMYYIDLLKDNKLIILLTFLSISLLTFMLVFLI